MFLETLDIRRDDILIYSQNIFNFSESFKIIHKKDSIKRPKKISYFDVCALVKDPSPKNLIVYRLLTNVDNLDAYSTKYGYFIKINAKVELIYFDPIFAIKDLRHLRFDLDPERFRFKIQQVGLTSLTKKEDEANFAEVYSFDMRAIEAQNQNDKIYADAIFAFDENFVDEEEAEVHKKHPAAVKSSQLTGSSEAEKAAVADIKNIAEDKSLEKKSLSAPSLNNSVEVQELREEIVSLLKQALGIPGQEEGKMEWIAQAGTAKTDEKKSTKTEDSKSLSDLINLFKSTYKTEEISNREKDSVILKFKRNE